MSAQVEPTLFSALRFDNQFVRQLPSDGIAENVRRQVRNACYSRVKPTPVRAPRLVAFSREVAELIGLDPAAIADDASGGNTFAQVFAGNTLVDGMDPHAC